MTHGALAASKQATSSKQSPHGPAHKWHSSGFGFHKKSMVSASAAGNQEILALRPPKHSRNGTRTGFVHTKKGSIDFGAAKAVGGGGLVHQPLANKLMTHFEKLRSPGHHSRSPKLAASGASVHLRNQSGPFFGLHDIAPHTQTGKSKFIGLSPRRRKASRSDNRVIIKSVDRPSQSTPGKYCWMESREKNVTS